MKLTLLLTGFIQVYFVAINTYLISKEMFTGVFICGFLISYIWAWNVKKVSIGCHADRIIYALGAACGAWTGLATSKIVYLIIHGCTFL